MREVDERIRILIENGVKSRHRSCLSSLVTRLENRHSVSFAEIHKLLSIFTICSARQCSARQCYKDKLEFSSHKKKHRKQVKKLMQKGHLDPGKVYPFSIFMESGGITNCSYKDSVRVLGKTFGMCILQDFEALNPNLLARTTETVEAGGLIILLLRTLSSLTSLYTMIMSKWDQDIHERFQTESHSVTTGRFNEHFLLSIVSCKACVIMDDELNILPVSSHTGSIVPVPIEDDSESLSEAEHSLKNLKEKLSEDFPAGPLIKKCCTLDQRKAVITFLDTILDKTLRSTVALLAARGCGKSATLGLAVAGAIAAGYSNIFVTARSPENLKTLFEFVLKEFDPLEYKEYVDYDVVKSSDSEFKKATVRINIYKKSTGKQSRTRLASVDQGAAIERRAGIILDSSGMSLLEYCGFHNQIALCIKQNCLLTYLGYPCSSSQYIQLHEHQKLSQVELLVVDEAATIPLPIVKSLLGPYPIFISSTVNGYEGTGWSLLLKLLQQLEEQSYMSKNLDTSISGQIFKQIELSESIRYASGGPFESWLNELPPPTECDLYYVNRDTLFSFHKDSELFLQQMMALYVASHYKNSPNDLQLMADAPAHQLFVLLGMLKSPVDESKNHLPDILCVIQFRDTVFPSLSGACIVRIATHPSAILGTAQWQSNRDKV
ncbi:hypothetical protein Cgig2_020016 [Carnegiea gigantea]|uniref:RNA cytidine acetyltransferase n=1 Tax=Carnegiea gigantea TaxID=171969 RepID=A0A9Q1KDU0_9CARY|nr:hypothetical protein Cgig2_020016 [Carnegiea gigantea]